jgi:thiamine-phosphate pyrophosphorylase
VKSLQDCRLYTFVDTAYLRGRNPAEVAQQLCDGGSDIIQLRAKGMEPDVIRRMSEQILPITQRANVLLVINDHPDIAREVGAPLAHLGQEDFFDAGHTRASEFAPVQIGLSTHAPEQALRAIAAEPAYIAIGPVYATGTKPTAKPVTLEYVRWASKNVSVPWFAIGGINLGNLDDVLGAGARRICVVSAILNAKSVSEACQSFRQRLLSAAL